MLRWIESFVKKIDRCRMHEELGVSREYLKDLADAYLMFRAPAFFDEFHLYSRLMLVAFLSLLYIYNRRSYEENLYIIKKGRSMIIVDRAASVREAYESAKKLTVLSEKEGTLEVSSVSKIFHRGSDTKKPLEGSEAHSRQYGDGLWC